METEPKKVKMTEAVITEEMRDTMRKKIGKTLRIDHSMNNEEATRTASLKLYELT